MTVEHVDTIVCPTCGGEKKCSTCHGAGSLDINSDGQRQPCYSCKGSGTCITCKGSGEYARTRPKLEPLRAPRNGYELCWSCEGLRYCGACLGSGRRADGTFCKVCDQHSGVCIECNGDGELKEA